jgi:hypothetical protein
MVNPSLTWHLAVLEKEKRGFVWNHSTSPSDVSVLGTYVDDSPEIFQKD